MTLTTMKMRDGLSPKDWVEKNAPLLKDPQFKYLDGRVLEATTQGVNGSVTVKIRLFVMLGEVVQIERYILKNVEGHWLIDDQEIQGDRVIGGYDLDTQTANTILLSRGHPLGMW